MFDKVVATIDLIFLILIWRDGRIMKQSSLRVEQQHERWFAERTAEREARRESAKKAREAKAAKSEGKNDGS